MNIWNELASSISISQLLVMSTKIFELLAALQSEDIMDISRILY